MLMDKLREFKLEVLYEKFHQAGVTPDIIWVLDDDILRDCQLTKIEKLRYKTAAANFQALKQFEQDPYLYIYDP